MWECSGKRRQSGAEGRGEQEMRRSRSSQTRSWRLDRAEEKERGQCRGRKCRPCSGRFTPELFKGEVASGPSEFLDHQCALCECREELRKEVNVTDTNSILSVVKATLGSSRFFAVECGQSKGRRTRAGRTSTRRVGSGRVGSGQQLQNHEAALWMALKCTVTDEGCDGWRPSTVSCCVGGPKLSHHAPHA